MNQKSIVRRVTQTFLVLAVLGTAATASARSQTVWSLLTDQNQATPNGTNYWLTNGLPVFSQTNGYDASGVVFCGARSLNNHSTSTIDCGTTGAAVTFQVFVRSSIANYCTDTAGKVPWGSPIVACNSPSLYLCSSASGCHSGYVLGTWGRGL